MKGATAAEVTFVRADAWIEGWPARDPDEAGTELVRRYLGAFGPATPTHFGGWWARQPPSKVRPWFARLGEELSLVDVEGEIAWVLTDDVEVLQRMRPSDTVRLLGNFDQYVLGPSSGSAAFIPAEHKAKVSRAAGWISRVVLQGGRVAGVWEPGDDGAIGLDLWEGVPARVLEPELARAAAVIDRRRS